MSPKYKINKYKEAIKKNVGREIRLYIKRGRKMLFLNDCILENAYESIFVVKICGESLIKERIVSVSYADLLTGYARVSIRNNAKLAQ